MSGRPTVWVLGDQLNTGIASLERFGRGECRVLLIESDAKIRSKPWHAQRLHLVMSAMAHFGAELSAAGFEVDYRSAPSFADGVSAHRAKFVPTDVIAMEPMSWEGRELLGRLGVNMVANNQFLCSHGEFAAWADGRSTLRMEDFYRWQRTRLGILLDDDRPAGGRWNFDDENRDRPPSDGRKWPEVTNFEPDRIDRAVAERRPPGPGAEPDGRWPVTRAQALTRLQEFIDGGLATFGTHEDAMLSAEWKLSHSVLSSSLNLGLLHPAEVVRAAEDAFRRGAAPINSVEGFIRQVIGWREYVWGLYWLWMPTYRDENVLGARRAVPPAFTGSTPTDMACVRSVVGHIESHGYAHHIERLMVLGNLAMTAGVDPWAMTEWMWSSFVDGAEWVMLPNVIGMALHADGGRMATKPYAAGGAYINRMSDHCRTCRFDPRRRVGDDACPFTTLYWDFLARHESIFQQNHRMKVQLGGLRRLGDLEEVRKRASEVLDALERGTL